MMSEGDSESQYRVRFSDFFSLLCFTKYEKSMSIDKYLINWLSLIELLINEKIRKAEKYMIRFPGSTSGSGNDRLDGIHESNDNDSHNGIEDEELKDMQRPRLSSLFAPIDPSSDSRSSTPNGYLVSAGREMNNSQSQDLSKLQQKRKSNAFLIAFTGLLTEGTKKLRQNAKKRKSHEGGSGNSESTPNKSNDNKCEDDDEGYSTYESDDDNLNQNNHKYRPKSAHEIMLKLNEEAARILLEEEESESIKNSNSKVNFKENNTTFNNSNNNNHSNSNSNSNEITLVDRSHIVIHDTNGKTISEANPIEELHRYKIYIFTNLNNIYSTLCTRIKVLSFSLPFNSIPLPSLLPTATATAVDVAVTETAIGLTKRSN